MTDKETKALKDRVQEIFGRFNVTDPGACLGTLKHDILRAIDIAGKNPKFKNGDVVIHVDDGTDIIYKKHMIISTREYGYLLENGCSIEMEDQDDWELADGPSIPEIMDEHAWEALDGEPAGEIWHDASESPATDRELICEGEFFNPLVLSSSSESFKNRKIRRWAYYDDLRDLSKLERTGKDLKESPTPHRLKVKVKEATGKLKELIDNMDEKELEKTRQLMEQEALAAEKERITSEYMEQMQKDYGYKDYTFWNGLKKGFDLGAGWNDRRFTEKVTILSDKIESLEAARVALKEVHNEDMKQLRQLMIDKACAWIDKEAHRYIVTRPIHNVEATVLDASITADFRKAMEDMQ